MSLVSTHGFESIEDVSFVPWEQVAVAVEDDGDGGVASPRGDLVGSSVSGDPEGDGGVAEVVGSKAGEAGGLDRGVPVA